MAAQTSMFSVVCKERDFLLKLPVLRRVPWVGLLTGKGCLSVDSVWEV